MLVAYGPDGCPVVAEEAPLEQLQSWSRDRTLYCPNCRATVHVRGGPDKRTQLHFAHQRGECAWSTESESVRHARGKLVIAQWLREQFPQATVTLEERLPEPNRIADIFVAHADGQRWAVEFQCAPLDIEEWKLRHEAYRKAGIIDTWIIGNNRREKQEAFIEAILAMAREIMFLDPLVTPARVWLRWPITRSQALEWQSEGPPPGSYAPTLDGWVGRMGYGMTLIGSLHEIRFDEQANLIHPIRATMEAQARLLQAMNAASAPSEAMLTAYLRQSVGEEALRVVLLPLLRAYLRDPELLRRYNYGRGLPDQPLSQSDTLRVQKAREWLTSLARRGFTTARLQELIKEIPFVGPYAAFAGFAETLIALV
ncbi:MAG TPA: competence protein CoiA family protein [Ktedonobacteraceae bacterium]|nr:competence protein CoiA family protein [Ktedonobacteraceae bacterium]